ncbi:hypothetical protein FRC00_008990 [Tulasnella sp. 408]|nr:hypothetical protein FRC00_008990 [Tulasnella sp. 408]
MSDHHERALTFICSKENRAQPGGTDHIYSHPKFLRGRKMLLKQIKSKSQGGESGKAFVARLRKELEEIEEKLSCSEREKGVLEARNKSLDAENRMLWAQLLQVRTWQPQPPLGGASAVLGSPSNGFQAL